MQIATAIVEGIAVYVMDLKACGAIHYEPVHPDCVSTSIADVPGDRVNFTVRTHRSPLVTSDAFVIGQVYEGKQTT